MISFNITKLAFLFLLWTSCQQGASHTHAGVLDTLSSMNLDERVEFELPVELEEISGHTFVKGNDDLVYCIQDESGTVYVFNLKNKIIEDTIKFAKDGDYEGITNDGIHFYVLKSNGSIFSFPISNGINNVDIKEFKGVLGKGEYESIGIDTVQKLITVLCKDCKVDRKKDQLTGYLLNYTSTGDVSVNTSFIIDLKLARAIFSKFPKVFNPSAITKNMMTNEWYILSSIDKLILITDENFTPKSVISFSRQSYEQPEGIAYDGQGNLYISSEKGSGRSGMIYKIK